MKTPQRFNRQKFVSFLVTAYFVSSFNSAHAGILNLLAPFTPPGLYPATSSPQSVARMNAVKVYNSGVHEWKNKNLKGAIECFQQALSFDPSMRELHGALGQVLYDAGFYEDAFRELQTATQDFPGDAAYWCMLGLASSHVQRYDVTVDAFQKYLKMKPHGGYADEAKRSIAILRHTVYGGQEDRAGNYFSEFSGSALRKWDSNMIPLRVFVADGSGLQGFDVSLSNQLRQSFNDWTLLSEGRIQFAFVDEPSKAQICCRWTADKNDLGGSDELGVTHSTWKTTGNIEHADIILLTIYESSPRAQEMQQRAKAVFLHEIGHALGLSHSQEPWDIMYPLVAPSGLEFPLTSRDKNTLLALYNCDPAGLIAKRFDASFPVQFSPANQAGMGAGSSATNYAPGGNGFASADRGQNMAFNAFSQIAPPSQFGTSSNLNAFPNPRAMPPPPMLASAPYAPVYLPGDGYQQTNAFSASQNQEPQNKRFSRAEMLNDGAGRIAAKTAAKTADYTKASLVNVPSQPTSGVRNVELISGLNRAAAQATARRDFDGAIGKLMAARAMAPNDQIILRNLGLAFGNAANIASEAGDYKKALQNFQSAFEILKTGADKGPYDQIYGDYQLMLKRQQKR